ncbi:MAG: Zn-dependent alcohol dehydrogenase [Dehalococcoidales bacterium]|nr:Zn-dependent alcohol dehydrogenase [Dehalococcoidales bacterium]
MKAAICYEFGKPLVIEEIDLEPPGKGEVKVRIAATAICHSDIHLIKGEFPGMQLPIVPGHESSGYVEEVGEGVASVKPGDAVCITLLSPCGKCPYCVTGLPHICTVRYALDTESRIRNKQGQGIGMCMKGAGNSEYAIVVESQLVRIPGDMPMDAASILSCGFTTGFGAVVNRAKTKPCSSVVVVGAGGVGTSSIQGAVISGAYPIIAIDILDNKLKAARSFGATHTVNSRSEDAIEAIQKLTSGRGADYVFMTVGSPEALKQSLAMIGQRGTVVVVGVVNEPVPLLPADFSIFEKALIGTKGGSINPGEDILHLIELYKAGRIQLDEMITGRYPLEQINEAIASVERGEALRNVIVF